MFVLLSIFGLLVFLGVSAEIAYFLLKRLFVWSESSRKSMIPLAVAFALGPYLVGLAVIVALAVLPGASHTSHLFSLALCFGVALFFALRSRGRSFFGALTHTWRSTLVEEKDLSCVLLLWIIALILNSIFIPVIQNDALEYLMVARDIFEARSLENYPAISTDTRSGFYGPWTHPPLYVGLLYLGNMLQGAAEIPVVARLIAPWFTAASTFLIFALGFAYSRRIGLVAAVLFIGAPLIFLGADSALIDGLPISASLIALAVWCAADVHRDFNGMMKFGMVLGLGLWTHSQSILFPLIFLGFLAVSQSDGPSFRLRDKGRMSVALLLGVLATGVWPYLNNLRKLGVLISDSPAVFAMAKLEWDAYFSMARGIHTYAAKIQYGLLKGFFAPEAYGLVFWVGLPTLHWCCRRLVKTRRRRSILREIAIFYIIYHLGVFASILIGIDLMIKNERYFLVVLGPAAVLAAMSVETARRAISSNLVISWFATRLFVIFLVLNFLIVEALYRVGPYIKSEPQVGWREVEQQSDGRGLDEHLQLMLQRWPNVRLVAALNTLAPEEGLVLSFRPADMFYAKRKMVSYLDPSLIPLYQAYSPEHVVDGLRKLNISHIHVPDYFTPPIYNTAFMGLLVRRDLVRLEVDDQGAQIYRVLDSIDTRAKLDPTLVHEFSPSINRWASFSMVALGGRKALLKLGAVRQETSSILFHREILNFSFNGNGLPTQPENERGLIPVSQGGDVALSLELVGDGFVKIYMVEFDQLGAQVQKPVSGARSMVRIGELVFNGEMNFERVLRLDPRSKYLRIVLETNGRTRVQVSAAKVTSGGLIPR